MISRRAIFILCLFIAHLAIFKPLDGLFTDRIGIFLASSSSLQRTLLALLGVVGAATFALAGLGRWIQHLQPSAMRLYVALLGGAAYFLWLLTLLSALHLPDRAWFAISVVDDLTLSLLGAGLLVLAMLARWKHRDEALKRGLEFILCFSAVIPVIWGQVAWAYVREAYSRTAPRRHPAVVQLRTGPSPVWILLFDELDYRLVAEDKGDPEVLPSLKRFRRESVHATQARTHAKYTLEAIPGLLLGTPVHHPQVTGRHGMDLPLEGGRVLKDWRGEGSLFDHAAALGRGTAIIGWYFPYGRFFRSVVGHCQSMPCDYFASWMPLSPDWKFVIDWLLFLSPGGDERLRGETAQHRDATRRFKSAVINLVHEGGADLVWMHWPIPHLPPLRPESPDYFGNLKEVDLAFSEFRSVLEVNGLWDASTVIVLSDHPLRDFWSKEREWIPRLKSTQRGADSRVPFLIKFPGQKEEKRLGTPFNSCIITPLVLEMLKGHVRNPETCEAWFEAQARR